MRTHLHPRRTAAAATAAGVLVAGVALGVVHSVTAGAAEPVPPSLATAIRDLTSEPRYAHSSFAIQVEDRSTGEVLVDERGDAMSTTGSVLKVYSTSTALHLYGQDHTFHTPVFRTGPVRNGARAGRPRARGVRRLLDGAAGAAGRDHGLRVGAERRPHLRQHRSARHRGRATTRWPV